MSHPASISPGRAIPVEIGDQMSRFPTPEQFASWARLWPGNRESTGQRRAAGTGRGNAWPRAALPQVAWAAARTTGRSCRALHHRHVAGEAKKAIVAVVVQDATLAAIWHMFTKGVEHEDPGSKHSGIPDEERRKHRPVRRLQRLGVDIQIGKAAWRPAHRVSGEVRSADPSAMECRLDRSRDAIDGISCSLSYLLTIPGRRRTCAGADNWQKQIAVLRQWCDLSGPLQALCPVPGLP